MFRGCLLVYPATTLQDVRLELAKEEAACTASVTGSMSETGSMPKVSLTGFFTTGFDLEDRQYVRLKMMREPS